MRPTDLDRITVLVNQSERNSIADLDDRASAQRTGFCLHSRAALGSRKYNETPPTCIVDGVSRP
jgi:hypothetical protein